MQALQSLVLTGLLRIEPDTLLSRSGWRKKRARWERDEKRGGEEEEERE